MGVREGILRLKTATRALVRRFAAETRGNVAMIFALSLPILVMLTMGGVDLSRAATARVNLQDALDAATLAAARSTATTDAALKEVGLRALKANLAGYNNVTLDETKVTFTLNADQVVIADAKVNVKAMVANIILPPYGKLMDDVLPVGAHSEVNRSSKNIEVGLVLDITGSMAGQRIIDLKDAAKQLVDIVVQSQQTPYYTRMAITPYSIGVNLGSYANSARGTPRTYTNVTDVSWAADTGKLITGISRANPAVITSLGHGLQTGDTVWISGLSAGTGNGTTWANLNSEAYVVTRINNSSYSIQQNTSGYRTFLSVALGVGTKCQVADCNMVVTSTGHGMTATTTSEGATRPSRVFLSNLGGVTTLNNLGYEIADVSNNKFSINVVGPTVANVYTSGGRAWCGNDGCSYRVFRNAGNNGMVTFPASSCVSERVGAQRYTDASPATYKVGTNYPAPAAGTSNASSARTPNPCPSAVIQPLTSDKPTLVRLIDSLDETGSTAGQIGLAWGWYTVSPNFNTLWSANPAGAYAPRDTLKAVILMTDGDFNSPYCSGVLAADAGTGSGDARDHINCDATNGDPFEQATALCNAIKAQGVTLYTVGFAVTANSQSARILSSCATGPDYAFLPASGDDLKDDFEAIGRDITRLRISK